jgi:transposase InsO family protein
MPFWTACAKPSRPVAFPTRLYMDNAKIYRSPQLARIAASIGILIVHTPPYQPEGRSKIERFFRSVREQFLASLDPKVLLSRNCIERIPLPQDVGLRLVEYLEQARPVNAMGRAVVVRCVAPHHHLTPTRVSTNRGGCCTAGQSRARPRASPAPYHSYATYTYRCVTTGNRSTLASPSYRDNSDLCEGRP